MMPSPDVIAGPPFQAHSETSRAAAESKRADRPTEKARVLAILREFPFYILGATDEQIQDELAMPSSTERPRRVELVKGGVVVDSGRTRPTRSGRQATVWAATSRT